MIENKNIFVDEAKQLYLIQLEFPLIAIFIIDTYQIAYQHYDSLNLNFNKL